MPLIYTSSLATPGVSTTSGTTNTETDAIYLKPAAAVPARNVALFSATVQGGANALTTISGIRFRIMRATTASTAGTATTPAPADSGMAAATAVASTGGTISSTGRTNHVIFGCGAAGPGGWIAPNVDAAITVVSAATQPSVDLLAVATNVSLTYEFSVQHAE
jgi:hypothetical protein